MAKVPLNGVPTWVKIGSKKTHTVVLLHGAMSSSESLLRSIGPSLATKYQVAAFDRRGHGRTPDTLEPFHYDTMADEAIAFLEFLGKPAHVVGHSDGANVALLVAMRRPDLLRRVVVVGANYHFEGLRPSEAFPLDGPVFERWAEWFAQRSPNGKQHAKAVVQKTNKLIAHEPTLTIEDLATILVPVLVMASDDEPIELAHTCSMYEAIPGAQLAIVPGTSHSMLKERTSLCVEIILHFLRSKWPTVTEVPVRRQP
jgi:pimeloyl-ACP methyl ester carboxylesterase